MTHTELFTDLSVTPSSKQASKLIAGVGDRENLGENFFETVKSLAGGEPSRAIQLAKHWRVMSAASKQPHYCLRARAIMERLDGQWNKSAQTFVAAAQQCVDPIERLSFQVGAIDSLARAGQITSAVSLGERLAHDLESHGEFGQASRVKLNVGNALLWADRYEESRRWLRQAIPVLESSNFELEAAAARLALSSADLYGGNPESAISNAESAQSFYELNGMPIFAGICAMNIAYSLILRGRADEGLQILTKVRPQLAGSASEEPTLEEYLGDAFLRLNCYEEALDCYQTALGLLKGSDQAYSLANCEYGRAQCWLATGELDSAASAFLRAGKSYLKAENLVWKAASDVGLATVRRLKGQLSSAGRLLANSLDSLEQAKAPYHFTAALIEHARLSLAADLVPESELEMASRLILKYGFVNFQWEVYALKASYAPTHQKLKFFRRSHEALLAARLLTRSETSRSRFMRDKGDLLGAYINALLEKPSAPRVREALSVITRTRSAALIDEILNSPAAEKLDRYQSRLVALREEIQSAELTSVPGSSERAGSMLGLSRIIVRDWIERTTAFYADSLSSEVEETDGKVAVFAETRDQIYRISSSRAEVLSVLPADLAKKLEWLEFDLFAPVVNPACDSVSVKNSLAQLKEIVGTHPFISPDSCLWKLPWQALPREPGEPEPTILLNPIFGTRAPQYRLPEKARVAVWYFDAPNLPHVRAEVDAIVQSFPQAELFSDIDDIRDSLNFGEYDLLHVAGHARLNAHDPMFSHLEFEGGKLYAMEIARSRLHASLVVLAGCQTGNFGFACKEEPEGLTRAFLARSAEAVVATSWSVDDESAKRFTAALYPELRRQEPLSECVGEAREHCRAWKDHPYYWAPFVIFGGYTRN